MLDTPLDLLVSETNITRLFNDAEVRCWVDLSQQLVRPLERVGWNDGLGNGPSLHVSVAALSRNGETLKASLGLVLLFVGGVSNVESLGSFSKEVSLPTRIVLGETLSVSSTESLLMSLGVEDIGEG